MALDTSSNNIQRINITPDTLVTTSSGTQTIAGNKTYSGSSSFNNVLYINNDNTIELGANVSGKQTDAGKIRYQPVSSALEIIGAGSAIGNRITYIYDNAVVSNNLTVNSNLTTTSLNVNDYATLTQLTVNTDLTVNNNLTTNSLNVDGNSTLNQLTVNNNLTTNSLNVNDNATLNQLTVDNNLTTNILNVDGNATLNQLTVNTTADISGILSSSNIYQYNTTQIVDVNSYDYIDIPGSNGMYRATLFVYNTDQTFKHLSEQYIIKNADYNYISVMIKSL